MKKWMPLLLAMAMLLCLCACDNTPDTEKPPAAPTTQGQPDPTNPADPTDPPETVSPVGLYGCTGLSTEGPDDYREAEYGELRFYPQTGDTNAVVIPTNDSLEKLMCDFTDYFEVLGDYYRAMLAQDWYFPDEEYLMSTCWNYQEDTPEDRRWMLNLGGDTLQLDLSVDGVTAERYTGTWSLNYSDGTGLVYLWMDLLRSDGEQIYVEYWKWLIGLSGVFTAIAFGLSYLWWML